MPFGEGSGATIWLSGSAKPKIHRGPSSVALASPARAYRRISIIDKGDQ
jgi:hypothetical protein